MSRTYDIYAEVKFDDKWFSINPVVKTVDGKYKSDCIYWSQSYFFETYNYLQDCAKSWGIPEDASEGVLSHFSENLDEKMDGWDITYRKYYQQMVFVVDFNEAIAEKIKKDRPFQYMGYVNKRTIAQFETDSIDCIENWYTADEYKTLSATEKKRVVWYEWNEPGDEYGILWNIYKKITNLLYWFTEIGIPFGGKYSRYDVSTNNVRVYVRVG